MKSKFNISSNVLSIKVTYKCLYFIQKFKVKKTDFVNCIKDRKKRKEIH